jgi:formylglycine-generating enzyme required for sulfatase activity
MPDPPTGAVDSLNRPVHIPGGFFWKGNPDPDTVSEGPYITWDESYAPETVDGFWIQEHEVTNAEYRRFDAEHAFGAGQERHPVVNLTWEEAMAYAASRGGRLPTETEWEFAARGESSRTYPWGEAEPECRRAHFGDCEPRSTLPVMSRPGGATSEGVHDLAGNVWEWVMPDWYLLGNFPSNNETRMSRGGSFRDVAFFLRASNRNRGLGFNEWFATDNLGFRVVWPEDQ